jgi:hypothetical protein
MIDETFIPRMSNNMDEIIIATGNYDKLWYFGKCYWTIPSGLKRITDEELTFKQSLVDLYKNETKPINTYWAQE